MAQMTDCIYGIWDKEGEIMTKRGCSAALENLKQNWYLVISMMAFYWLAARVNLCYTVLALAASLCVAAYLEPVWKLIVQGNWWLRGVSALTAVGICLGNYVDWCTYARKQEVQAMLPVSPVILGYVTKLCAVLSLVFVYVCVVLLLKRLAEVAEKTGLFRGMTRWEWAEYALLLVLLSAVMAAVFQKTEVFYGTEYSFDNVYTADSPILVKENAYIALSHAENDIRQPLFAVFAAPFLGIAELVCQGLSLAGTMRAIVLNVPQIALLLAATFLLCRMMDLTPGKRMLFTAVCAGSYTYLLFGLMMEQYIVAYFWLVFFLYEACTLGKPDSLALWGAGGTLLTSMILLPLMSERNPVKEFREWFRDMVKQGMGFVAAVLVFFRGDVLLNVVSQMGGITGYAGSSLTFWDKLRQYVAFVGNCFLAPAAGVDFEAVDHVSWKMDAVTKIDILGILILVLVIVGALWNWDKRSSRLALGWVGFSVVLLLIMGWGTAENGLLLYALYFGWAFFLLLFQLVQRLDEKWGRGYLLYAVGIAGVFGMLAVNLPALAELVEFGIACYPV